MVGACIHEIKYASHVELLHGRPIHERQIHCTAARMAGTARNIAKLENLRFLYVWVMDGFAAVILHIQHHRDLHSFPTRRSSDLAASLVTTTSGTV